jgi:hypothetical protein
MDNAKIESQELYWRAGHPSVPAGLEGPIAGESLGGCSVASRRKSKDK